MNSNLERRYFNSSVWLENRSGSNSRRIIGYALKFSSNSNDLGGFIERIDPKALDGADLSDVVCLFNHEKNMLLARTSSKTLKLRIDNIGLQYEFEAPETTVGNDLLVSLGRRDIVGSSFCFILDKDKWENVGGIQTRTILKFKRIIDVSPVTFPAYPATDVGNRNKPINDSLKFPERDKTKLLLELYRRY